MKPLKYFDTIEDVLDYVIGELRETLQDDINNMEHEEDNAEDCNDLRNKIHDIGCLEDAVAERKKMIETARAITALEKLIGGKL